MLDDARVEVAELGVPVDVLAALGDLGVGLQAEPLRAQHPRHRPVRHPMPAAVSASARLRVDFVVHTSGDIGSPRVCGSTSARKAGASPGSFSVAGLRPPPGARTRPAGSDTALELPHPLGHRVRVHPGRHGNRLDPTPAQLRRLRAEQQAAP